MIGSPLGFVQALFGKLPPPPMPNVVQVPRKCENCKWFRPDHHFAATEKQIQYGLCAQPELKKQNNDEYHASVNRAHFCGTQFKYWEPLMAIPIPIVPSTPNHGVNNHGVSGSSNPQAVSGAAQPASGTAGSGASQALKAQTGSFQTLASLGGHALSAGQFGRSSTTGRQQVTIPISQYAGLSSSITNRWIIVAVDHANDTLTLEELGAPIPTVGVIKNVAVGPMGGGNWGPSYNGGAGGAGSSTQFIGFEPAYATSGSPPETRFGELTGYRCWMVTDDGYLKSASANVIWMPGVPMTAGLTDQPRHDEHYGIHAFKDANRAMQYNNGTLSGNQCAVYGEVKMWGEVYEHDLGYRSEFASISKLMAIRGTPGRATHTTLESLRTTYGV